MEPSFKHFCQNGIHVLEGCFWKLTHLESTSSVTSLYAPKHGHPLWMISLVVVCSTWYSCWLYVDVSSSMGSWIFHSISGFQLFLLNGRLYGRLDRTSNTFIPDRPARVLFSTLIAKYLDEIFPDRDEIVLESLSEDVPLYFTPCTNICGGNEKLFTSMVKTQEIYVQSVMCRWVF